MNLSNVRHCHESSIVRSWHKCNIYVTNTGKWFAVHLALFKLVFGRMPSAIIYDVVSKFDVSLDRVFVVIADNAKNVLNSATISNFIDNSRVNTNGKYIDSNDDATVAECWCRK